MSTFRKEHPDLLLGITSNDPKYTGKPPLVALETNNATNII
ncbi:hypothetical protein N8603_03165 [Verrucomicrobiales bacterium]|nr:hypothetical protein [Verrucomicrobiales bacterium]